MSDELKNAEEFMALLARLAAVKAKLYDGSNMNLGPDTALRFAAEELGEVASAMTRERWLAAQSECIDLAHTAMLMWMSMKGKIQ